MANVILSIGSKFGPGGLASLQAGLQMLGAVAGKMAEVWKEGQQYGQMARRLTIDIGAADRATKGLIDTTELMRGALKAQQAQTGMTSRELEAIAKVAVQHARTIGVDVTTAYTQLIDGITKGNERALKPLGIEMLGITELADKQRYAIDELTKRAEGLTVEYETMDERLYALSNSLGTLTNEVVAGAGEFVSMNKAVESLIEATDRLVGSIGDYGVKGTLVNGLEAGRFAALDWALTLATTLGLVDDNAAAVMRLAKAQQFFTGLRDRGAQHAADKEAGKTPAGPAEIAPRRRGGGGKSKAPRVDEMVFTSEEVALAEQNDLLDIQIERRELTLEQLAQSVEFNNLILGIEEVRDERIDERWVHEIEAQERELDFAERYGAAWVQNLDQIDMAARMANTTFNAMQGVTEHWLRGIITGAPFAGKAVKKMIAQMAFSEAVYYAAQALAKLGSGVYNAISPYGSKREAAAAFAASAKYAAAAAMFGVVSAALGGPGGGQTVTGAAGTTGGGYGSGGGFLGAGAGPPAGSGGSGDTKIDLSVNLDGEVVYRSVQTHNDNEKKAGRFGAFAEA